MELLLPLNHLSLFAHASEAATHHWQIEQAHGGFQKQQGGLFSFYGTDMMVVKYTVGLMIKPHPAPHNLKWEWWEDLLQFVVEHLGVEWAVINQNTDEMLVN